MASDRIGQKAAELVGVPPFEIRQVTTDFMLEQPQIEENIMQVPLNEKLMKSIAQEYNIPVFAPYQTDNSGEARFAKGILDAADAAFTMETWSPEDECITFNCTKMRSAKMEGFTSTMDWETLKIGPQSTMNPKARDELKDSLSTGEDIHDAI